ncbi:MAG: PIN domain-containing protein [Chloroflexota bacterium]
MNAIPHNTRLFFDASVLVAASLSARGGSAYILAACQQGRFRAQTSLAVISEAHSAAAGISTAAERALRRWIETVAWEMVPVPDATTLARYGTLVAAKDVHVLAAAAECGSEFLLTLDRRHLLAAAAAVAEAALPITILRPGDLIQRYFASHPDGSLPTAQP